MNRRALITIVGATMLAPAAQAPLTAQSLAARINAAPSNGTVTFTFPSKPEVCGDGTNIMIRREDGHSTVMRENRDGDNISTGRNSTIENCEPGPVKVQLTRSSSHITGIQLRVGGSAFTGATDLGSVSAEAAVDWLLTAGVDAADAKPADRMVLAATLANAESWPQLLSLARRKEQSSRARSSAIFWLAQAAGDKATAGLKSLVGDQSDELEVRETAIFALTQIRSTDSVTALMDIARTNAEPRLRRSAMFWLGQSKDPRVLAFFEDILKG